MLGMYFFVKQLKIQAVDFKDSRKITVGHNRRYALGSAMMFALSTGVRSNGILLSGFFLYDWLRFAVANTMRQSLWHRLKFTVWTTLQVAITFAPYVGLQVYAYYLYCTPSGNPTLAAALSSSNQTTQADYLSNTHPWCLYRLPHIYNYIQGRYWNVGFLKYYRVAQIPNFLLAAPIVSFKLKDLRLSLFFYCCFFVAHTALSTSRHPIHVIRVHDSFANESDIPVPRWRFHLCQRQLVHLLYARSTLRSSQAPPCRFWRCISTAQ